jgi:hypothetical protein
LVLLLVEAEFSRAAALMPLNERWAMVGSFLFVISLSPPFSRQVMRHR